MNNHSMENRCSRCGKYINTTQNNDKEESKTSNDYTPEQKKSNEGGN